jgi:RND family efflux transporter MFP subunit
MRLSAVLCILALSAPAAAIAEGSVAVRVVPARRGSAPSLVTAYGQAAPAGPSVRTLSLAQPGQVAAVLVTASQAVKRGQALLRFDTAPATLAAYRQAETALTLARAQRAHTQQLFASQLATQDQLGAAEKALADAQAQLQALARDGSGAAHVTVSAPADGVVMGLAVAAGDRPAPGAALATFAPASAMQVSVGIEPGWRGQVRIGQSVRLDPLGGGPSLAGRVVRVDSALNPKTRLVDVAVATPSGAVIAGEAFRAAITVGGQDGWLVPHGAVQVEDGKAFLYQVAGSTAARVNVTVRQPGRETDLMQGPIDAHRPIVSVGGHQLNDGAAVRVER